MSVTFSNGTNESFSGWVGGRAWNDPSLLGLNPSNSWDNTLITVYNTKQFIEEMLRSPTLTNVRPEGYVSKLGDAVSGPLDVMVVKGLHQWRSINGPGYQRVLHFDIGLDGVIWHIYCGWNIDRKSVMPTGEMTRGEFQADVTHDDFQKIGGNGKRKPGRY